MVFNLGVWFGENLKLDFDVSSNYIWLISILGTNGIVKNYDTNTIKWVTTNNRSLLMRLSLDSEIKQLFNTVEDKVSLIWEGFNINNNINKRHPIIFVMDVSTLTHDEFDEITTLIGPLTGLVHR